MAPVTVKLPDGSPLELPEGASGADAAAAIGPRLAKDALGIKVDGELRDLSAPLPDGAEIAVVTAKSKGADADDALWLIRHDAAHVMAEAVVDLWPGTKVSIGPPIEGGFYYDFEFPDGQRPTEADLERIEAAMAEHIAADEPFEREDIPVAEALERFRAADQPYKVELIEDLVRDEGVETVSLYRNGPFVDLCRGPHAPSTGRIKAFKLNSLAGAYWRGDENRQMLTRIYGTAFHSQADLDEHLARLEQARENDHRKLGPQLDLFRLREESPGMPFWLPQGTVLLRLIEREVREQLESAATSEIKTPAGARRGALAPLRPLGQLPREHVLRRAIRARGRRAALRAEADELPRAPASSSPPSVTPTGSCRCAWPSSETSRATSARVSCTASCECARSPRTTPTSTARSTRSPDEVDSICEAIDELYARFGFDEVRVELSTRPEKSIGDRRAVGARRGGAARGARAPAAAVRGQPRRGRPSTGRRSTSMSPTRLGAPGSSGRARSTSRCRRGSSSPTRARTTQTTRR